MSAIFRLCVAVVLCVSITSGEDLHVGSLVNTTLVYSEEVKLSSIPLITREKNVFYNTNNATKIIRVSNLTFHYLFGYNKLFLILVFFVSVGVNSSL